MQGRDAVSACFFGEGAVNQGAFHEAVNLAAIWDLPALFVCENNRYAMGTSIDRELSDTDLCVLAESYRVPSASTDGMDVLASHAAMQQAVKEGAPLSRALAERPALFPPVTGG